MLFQLFSRDNGHYLVCLVMEVDFGFIFIVCLCFLHIQYGLEGTFILYICFAFNVLHTLVARISTGFQVSASLMSVLRLYIRETMQSALNM